MVCVAEAVDLVPTSMWVGLKSTPKVPRRARVITGASERFPVAWTFAPRVFPRPP